MKMIAIEMELEFMSQHIEELKYFIKKSRYILDDQVYVELIYVMKEVSTAEEDSYVSVLSSYRELPLNTLSKETIETMQDQALDSSYPLSEGEFQEILNNYTSETLYKVSEDCSFPL
ncbi:hypothetical protein ACFSCX_06490 [Bacillus salitolerans]|uniref:Uncharacterized protein n=1 Tax=Bacillus salitolerans TaxID=1437434 RepID=A0ABW4LNZ6_9BACI